MIISNHLAISSSTMSNPLKISGLPFCWSLPQHGWCDVFDILILKNSEDVTNTVKPMGALGAPARHRFKNYLPKTF